MEEPKPELPEIFTLPMSRVYGAAYHLEFTRDGFKTVAEGVIVGRLHTRDQRGEITHCLILSGKPHKRLMWDSRGWHLANHFFTPKEDVVAFTLL